ncbi:MAG: aldehyde dehydrogenase family protein [Actinobacteria bacterium]|nr:aldehyde dehydrogenase family protein [Actinomycetota bacterium]
MTMESINPHRPSDRVARFEPAGPDGVESSITRAGEAFGEWSAQTAIARGTALRQIADDIEGRAGEFAELMVREVGKPLAETQQEIGRAVSIFRYHAQMALAPNGLTYPAADASSWLMEKRFPLGVCGLLTPWNFPIAIPVWKLAPALACGNTAVLKPAPQATATAQLLHEIAKKHLPEGVFELVTGDAETGEPLVDNPGVAAVSFTGSVPVGHEIAKRVAGRGAKLQCEMGGQNPSVVLADADLDKAAAAIAFATMGYAGQKCTATSRVIIESSVYGAFKDKLVTAVEEMGVEDPSRETCKVGPLIEEAARQNALDAIQDSGGNVVTGGSPLDAEGFYIAPTLVEIEDRSSVLAKEEVFAPVVALLEVGSPDEGIALANDVRFGLVAAVFTSDLGRAMEYSGKLEAGLVRVNAPTSGVDFHAPFGGSKESSIGPREQGLAARDFFTESRTLLISP